jgi:hypothetical protein
MKIARWSIGLLLILPFGLPAGQQGDQPTTQQPSSSSLVDAARRSRELKKEQPKAVRVWNDDNVPKTDGVSVVGQTPAPAGASASAGGNNPGAAPAPVPENLTGVAAELDAAKEHLKSLQTDLDILQRKSALDEQMYLSKPEYENDKEAAAGLKSEQDKVAALQAEIVEEQKKVDQLQAKLSASAPASTSN